ncbi:MAG: amidohydrolase family protein [Salibacteraceae bacterium]
MKNSVFGRKSILAGLFALLLSPTVFGQALTYLHCGKVIDGSSEKVQTEMTIIVQDGRITSIQKGYLEVPQGATLIDHKNRTVLPGLMDMHVHMDHETSPDGYSKSFRWNDADYAFESVNYAKTTLMAGFTTVRDLGGTGVNIALRNAINRGTVIGPRIFTAGKAIAITGGHADPTNGWNQTLMGDPGPREGVVNGTDDCRKAVRQRYKNGTDLIKITATGGVLSVAKDGTGPHFTEIEMGAIVETANDLGMRIAAHCHGAEGMKRAVRAGVTSIEHGTYMDEETMKLMIERGTWYVPTITAGRAVADSAKIMGYYPKVVVPKALKVGPQIQNTFGVAYKRGVKIAFGTDAGVFKHGLNALEFQYMVEAGMPAMETIRCATLYSAQLLGIEADYGTLETGKVADIIAVDGDPLQDVSVLMNVAFVMKDGVVYKG